MINTDIQINSLMSILFAHLSIVYLNKNIVQNPDNISISDMVALSEAIYQYQQHPPTVDFIEVDSSNKQHPIHDAIEEHV